MTDREIVFGLLGLIDNDTSLLVRSLVLLKKEIPLETIAECQKEMNRMVQNLCALSEPEAKAFIKDLLDELRNRGDK